MDVQTLREGLLLSFLTHSNPVNSCFTQGQTNKKENLSAPQSNVINSGMHEARLRLSKVPSVRKPIFEMTDYNKTHILFSLFFFF